MSSQPKISFVIPVKNRAHLITDALKSLQDQTIPDWEAVIVDDYSSDNLEEVVAAFGDARVRYVKLPPARGMGVASARNYGNFVAKADLIAVLDSDDLALPNRAELALASYAKHKWDFYGTARHTLGVNTGALTEQKVRPEKWDAELFKVQSFITHSSVVYTKKAALEIPYNSALGALDDYDLISRFIELGKKIHYSPIKTVIWRKHDSGSLTEETGRERGMAYLRAIRSFRGWTTDEPDWEKIG